MPAPRAIATAAPRRRSRRNAGDRRVARGIAPAEPVVDVVPDPADAAAGRRLAYVVLLADRAREAAVRVFS
jgi:hypothetical protein